MEGGEFCERYANLYEFCDEGDLFSIPREYYVARYLTHFLYRFMYVQQGFDDIRALEYLDIDRFQSLEKYNQMAAGDISMIPAVHRNAVPLKKFYWCVDSSFEIKRHSEECAVPEKGGVQAIVFSDALFGCVVLLVNDTLNQRIDEVDDLELGEFIKSSENCKK